MGELRHPSLYQINTRIWLQELAPERKASATFDDVPDSALDRISELGFDWVWLLGVWQTGPAGRAVSRSQPQWRQEFQALLPDLTDQDICGSPFAIRSYVVQEDFGNDDSLLHLRQRLHQRGLRLLLDFVPNHTALDHPWVYDHPEFYIQGEEADLAREPHNYYRADTRHAWRVLAHGRDPYFPGWPDTLQLNYRHAALRLAMIGELAKIAALCDGVRCDMAMLLLPDILVRTWGNASLPADGTPPVDSSFWPEAIAVVKRKYPPFVFLAEAYWDLEWELQQQRFDYTYDKRYYDLLHAQDAAGVRSHLRADLGFQNKSVHFLENHDEPRAAGVFPEPVHRAAALLTYLVPGMRFFHEGQLEGRRLRTSVHLRRRPQEPIDFVLQKFYRELLECLQRPEVRDGHWQLLECRPAWKDNPTFERFLAFSWESGQASGVRQPPDGNWLLVTVNHGPVQSQCYVSLPAARLRGKTFLLRDVLSPARYERNGDELAQRGLYLDMPAWGYHVFDMVEL